MADLRVVLQDEAARLAWGMVQAFTPELDPAPFVVVAKVHRLGPHGNQAKAAAQLADWQRAAQLARG